MIKLRKQQTEFNDLVYYYYVDNKMIVFYKRNSFYRIWMDYNDYRDFNKLSSAIHHQLFIGIQLL